MTAQRRARAGRAAVAAERPQEGAASRQVSLDTSAGRLGAESPIFGHSEACLTLILPYPPTVNTLWRRVGNRTVMSAAGREYAEIVAGCVAIARLAGQRVPPPPHSVSIVATLPDRRRRDLDNLLKSILDSVYRAIDIDDSEVVRIEAVKHWDSEGARIRMLIEPAEIVDGEVQL